MRVSVIVRAKDEGKWIERCLKALRLQRKVQLEVTLVDNESSDRTVEIARRFGCRIVELPDEEFSFGRALNKGIDASKGEFIAILSAHGIPVNDIWAVRLLAGFYQLRIAGVYGRQEPLPDSSDFDKRDLWTTFGLDRRVQMKDYFFHNANCMIRRAVWERYPFDETLSGVEDRAWAKQVLSAGYRIVYEPTAGVYHHHGIHQGRDEERAARVVRVIQMIQGNQ